jgi:hypothetical protein
MGSIGEEQDKKVHHGASKLSWSIARLSRYDDDTVEHAHHFLSRLDRLSNPHVELALSLYRDHDLLKFILDSVKVPDGVERVAISLADPQRGPFLVITRDGKFVTCLGEGMSKGTLMVIPREKVDGLATRVEVLRGRIEVAKKVTGERGGVGRLFRRLYDAGSRLSREEFIAAAAWQPMLFMDFLRWMLDTAADVKEARPFLLRQLRRTDKLSPRFADAARDYNNSVWFIGHTAALAALDGKLPFEDLPPKAYDAMHELPYAWSAVRQGLVGPALRGIWGAGRVGKLLLPRYKQLYGESATLYRVIETTYSLAAIGLRHSRLAAEVEKALASPLPRIVGEVAEYQKLLDLVARTISQVYKTTRVKRDVLPLAHLNLGRTIAMDSRSRTKAGSRFTFTRAEDVPEDIAYALPFNTCDEFVADLKNIQVMSFLVPWLATAEAEQLYLPAEYLSDVPDPYDNKEIMPLLLALRDIDYKTEGQTRSTPKGSARNEPCPCGSGLKYKRCCFGKSAIVPVEKTEQDAAKVSDVLVVEPENDEE